MKPLEHELYVAATEKLDKIDRDLLLWRFRNPLYESVFGSRSSYFSVRWKW